MKQNRLDLLSDRHREVLRLRGRRLRIKEIAAEIGISENTASGYLTEAAALLDAGGREGAVALLTRYEADHPEARGRFSVGDGDQIAVPARQAAVQAEPSVSWRALLPFRLGAAHNDLSVVARLLWIPVLALVIAIGFSAVASAVRVISDLARGHGAG